MRKAFLSVAVGSIVTGLAALAGGPNTLEVCAGPKPKRKRRVYSNTIAPDIDENSSKISRQQKRHLTRQASKIARHISRG